MEKLLEVLGGLLGTHNLGAGSTVFDAAEQLKRLTRRQPAYSHVLQDAAAATATAFTPFFRAHSKCRVVAAHLLPIANLTANDTNYATISLKKEDGAAGGAATLGQLLTKITGGTGNWAAKVTEPITLTVANCELDEGHVLGVDVAKAAAGVQLDRFHVVVEIEERA
jgi:hypothetical protein